MLGGAAGAVVHELSLIYTLSLQQVNETTFVPFEDRNCRENVSAPPESLFRVVSLSCKVGGRRALSRSAEALAEVGS